MVTACYLLVSCWCVADSVICPSAVSCSSSEGEEQRLSMSIAPIQLWLISDPSLGRTPSCVSATAEWCFLFLFVLFLMFSHHLPAAEEQTVALSRIRFWVLVGCRLLFETPDVPTFSVFEHWRWKICCVNSERILCMNKWYPSFESDLLSELTEPWSKYQSWVLRIRS